MLQSEAKKMCDDRGMYLLPLDIGSSTYLEEMENIGLILDRLTGIRWGLRMWLPYNQIDDAWVPDYGQGLLIFF